MYHSKSSTLVDQFLVTLIHYDTIKNICNSSCHPLKNLDRLLFLIHQTAPHSDSTGDERMRVEAQSAYESGTFGLADQSCRSSWQDVRPHDVHGSNTTIVALQETNLKIVWYFLKTSFHRPAWRFFIIKSISPEKTLIFLLLRTCQVR